MPALASRFKSHSPLWGLGANCSLNSSMNKIPNLRMNHPFSLLGDIYMKNDKGFYPYPRKEYTVINLCFRLCSHRDGEQMHIWSLHRGTNSCCYRQWVWLRFFTFMFLQDIQKRICALIHILVHDDKGTIYLCSWSISLYSRYDCT